MHPSVQTAYNEVAKTLIGLTVKAEKPVKKASTLLHSEAFKRAHEKTNALIAFERSRPSRRDWKPTAAERQFMFGKILKDAYAMIRFERDDAPAGPVFITDEQSRFIGSDSRWR
ncbi:hypothetical protein GTN27_04200 [Ochrobactrum sp. EEELCW01]|nr:hypothetical protein GTN27_04200 [Ochrobactrum sp. EEELCW01]